MTLVIKMAKRDDRVHVSMNTENDERIVNCSILMGDPDETSRQIAANVSMEVQMLARLVVSGFAA